MELCSTDMTPTHVFTQNYIIFSNYDRCRRVSAVSVFHSSGGLCCSIFLLCERFIYVYNGFLCFVHLQEPLKLDIVISFPDHGFHLRFDPWSQVFLFSLFMKPTIDFYLLKCLFRCACACGGGYGLKRLSELFYYCIFNRKHDCFNGHYQNATIYLWDL